MPRHLSSDDENFGGSNKSRRRRGHYLGRPDIIFSLKQPFSWLGFVLLFGLGAVVSNRVFERYSNSNEKKEDLEERNRNGLG